MGDRGCAAPARLLVILALGAGIGTVSLRAASSAGPDIGPLLSSVGERVEGYYRRAQSIICLETATVQPIHSNWSLAGMARTVISELRMEGGATVRREVRRINGREPRDRDKTDRTGCTDPDVLSTEPLAFLLPDRREEFVFTATREGREKNRPTFVIDFASTNQRSRADLIEDPRGHDDCFDWSGPIATRGQVWVDAETYDVLRVERHNAGPVDLRISWALQRRYNFDQHVTLDRDDLTLRYKPVTFSEPDETLVLPDTIESMTIVRNTLQSTRRTTTFTDYRRFLTASRVKLP